MQRVAMAYIHKDINIDIDKAIDHFALKNRQLKLAVGPALFIGFVPGACIATILRIPCRLLSMLTPSNWAIPRKSGPDYPLGTVGSCLGPTKVWSSIRSGMKNFHTSYTQTFVGLFKILKYSLIDLIVENFSAHFISTISNPAYTLRLTRRAYIDSELQTGI
jgi:hypothetical protein